MGTAIIECLYSEEDRKRQPELPFFFQLRGQFFVPVTTEALLEAPEPILNQVTDKNYASLGRFPTWE